MSRVRTGFHRLGAVIAIPLAITGCALLVVSVTASRDPTTTAFFGGAFLVCAALAYALARGVAWVIEGFTNDGSRPKPAATIIEPQRREPVFDDGSQVQAQEREISPKASKELVGIRGWLVLPALSTLVSPLFVGKTLFDDLSIAFTIPFGNNAISWLLYAEITANVFLLVLSIYLIVLLKDKDWRYPKVFIAFLATAAIVGIADTYTAGVWFGAALTSADTQALGRSVASCAIWIPYILLSRRVRNTFRRDRGEQSR